MKTIDFKEMGVRELEGADVVKTDGGVVVSQVTLAWLRALVTYVNYSMDTGGAYVTHHAQ